MTNYLYYRIIVLKISTIIDSTRRIYGYDCESRGDYKILWKQIAVRNVSMEVKKGDIYGFIGENGAGKTTMIRMMAGLAKPSSGRLSLFGSGDLVKAREKIGTVIEYPALMPGMTARENLMVEMKLRGLKDTEKD